LNIDASGLFTAICSEALRGTASYNDIAAAIDAGGDGSPSRQAVAGRMNAACLRLFEAILARAVRFRLVPALAPATSGFLARYQRVLVQDSTIVKLPARLFGAFSGVSNAQGPTCNGRIQAVYDLRNLDFVSFSIDSYSRNDRAAAPSLEVLRGDLVLRDRGYFTADEIARHVAAGADCVYRHKTGTTYLDPETREPLDLLELLRRDGHSSRSRSAPACSTPDAGRDWRGSMARASVCSSSSNTSTHIRGGWPPSAAASGRRSARMPRSGNRCADTVATTREPAGTSTRCTMHSLKLTRMSTGVASGDVALGDATPLGLSALSEGTPGSARRATRG